MVVALRAHTAAVLTAVRAALSPTLVGDGETPEGTGWISTNTFIEYAVLHPRPEGRYSGTLGAKRTTKERVYQVSCVGRKREQSEWLADKVTGILDTLTVTGHRMNRAELEGSPGTFRDPDTDPPVFVTPILFRITTTS